MTLTIWGLLFSFIFRACEIFLLSRILQSQTLAAFRFELKLTGELSYRAQKMAEEHPDKAITWYAIGCFCFLKGEMETARTHFA